jgi:PhnB protein
MAKVQAIPQGHHTITPHFVVSDAAAAIELYKKAFGAEEIARMPAPDGKSIWHAEIKIGDSIIYLGDESVAMGAKSAKTMGGSPMNLHLYVENVDEAFKRAQAAGLKVKMPLTDMFWGDRYGVLTDEFGYEWALAQHTKDLTPEEMAKGAEEAAKQFGQK